jgi:hypothetical protein
LSLSFRCWWVPVLAATLASAALAIGADTGDLPFFVHAADDLFSTAWEDAYADPALQVGPVQLFLLALVDTVAGVVGISTFTLLAFAIPLGVCALLLVVLRRLLADRPERRRLVLLSAGLAAVALGIPSSAYVDGHLAQAVVPLLWLLAGLKARDERTLAAGALVGFSAGFEAWGMLGAVVLLLAPRVREAAAGLAVQVAVATAMYAPFALAGDLRMFDYHWVVNGDTLLSLVVEPGTDFTWWMRLTQGAAALSVGAALAWPLRRTLHALWLGPLAVVTVRLALDPVRFPWYWLALQVLVLVAVVEIGTSGRFRRYYPARASH